MVSVAMVSSAMASIAMASIACLLARPAQLRLASGLSHHGYLVSIGHSKCRS